MRTRRDLSTPLLALLPTLALVAGALLTWPVVGRWQGDLAIYARYADELMRGALPYRDFRPEYPPLALLPFVVPRVLVLGRPLSADAYRLLFLMENAVFCWLTACTVLAIAHQTKLATAGSTAALLTVLVAILSPLLPWRFDLFPALLTALALLALLRNQPAVGGIWLGLGVAAKLYPIVLGPVFGLQYLVLRRWRALGALVAGGAIALALTVLPFWLIDRTGLLAFLTYHEQRGVQLESLAGGVVCLGHMLGFTTVQIEFNYGAMHLASPWSKALLPWLTPLLLLVYGTVLLVAYTRLRANLRTQAPDGQALVQLSVAALLAFIVTNKVFSPQYVVWLLPFAPLLPWRHYLAMVMICVATVLIFPFNYDALLGLQPLAILLLNARNAAMLGLLIWVLADLLSVPLTARVRRAKSEPHAESRSRA